MACPYPIHYRRHRAIIITPSGYRCRHHGYVTTPHHNAANTMKRGWGCIEKGERRRGQWCDKG
jgi:hypothetical protein